MPLDRGPFRNDPSDPSKRTMGKSADNEKIGPCQADDGKIGGGGGRGAETKYLLGRVRIERLESTLAIRPALCYII